MSAQQSSPMGLPPSEHGGGSGSDVSGGDPHQPDKGVASGGQNLPLATTAELANLLANGQWDDGLKGSGINFADANAYDGHVALALDTGVLPDINATLDLLTSSHHLFDVPALDVSSGFDDSSSA